MNNMILHNKNCFEDDYMYDIIYNILDNIKKN